MFKNLFKKPLFWITTGSISVGGITTVSLVSSSESEPTSIVYETGTTVADNMEKSASDINNTLQTEIDLTEPVAVTPDSDMPDAVKPTVNAETPSTIAVKEVSALTDSIDKKASDDSPNQVEKQESTPQQSTSPRQDKFKESVKVPDTTPVNPQKDNPPSARQEKETDSPADKKPEKQPDPQIEKGPVQKQEPEISKKTEEPKPSKTCNHKWTWASHTETIHHEATYKQVPVYSSARDEIVETTKVKCAKCHQLYEDDDDYDMRDRCMASFYDITVPTGEVIHHDPELLYMDEVIDQEAWDETITINDYQYCSVCGERKQ